MLEVMTCPTTPDGWCAISDKFLLRCTKWEAHCLQVSSKEWFPIFQLQGILLCCTMALVDSSSYGRTSVVQHQYQTHWSKITLKSKNWQKAKQSDSLPQIPYKMTTMMYPTSSSATMPSPSGRPWWSHTAVGVWTMRWGYLTTGPRQEGGWKCLRNPGEHASRFCWLPCSITPPLSKSSWKLELSCTI